MYKTTKKERNEIYRIAFEKHLEAIRNNESEFSMCDDIDSAIEIIFFPEIKNISYIDLEPINLKEFIKLKPKDISVRNYWWDEGNFKIRTKMYNKIIKQTE